MGDPVVRYKGTELTETITNWAGNHTLGASRVHRPRTVQELQSIVSASKKVKAAGSLHSFNSIADTVGDLVSLERFLQVDSVDPDRRTVRLGAGVRYGALCQQIHREGWAIHNLASLPHISVAGAIATATHGSGDRNGNLATAVRAITMVMTDGKLRTFTRDENDPAFPGAVVHLGALGIVTELTLDVIPAFQMRQDVYEVLPLEILQERFEEVFSRGYSVSLFTDWSNEVFAQVWVKRPVVDGEDGLFPDWCGAKLAKTPLHPLPDGPSVNCTQQGGIPGPWYERLPHFRMGHTPSSGDELQSEYFVPRRHACDALRTLFQMGKLIRPHLRISEVRTIDADSLWMSPCFARASVGIHFTWKKDTPAVQALLPRIEAALSPFEARPHWGKLFTVSPERLESLYERMADFRALVATCDPEGKFRNAYLDYVLYGVQ